MVLKCFILCIHIRDICEHVKLDVTIQYNDVFSIPFCSNHNLAIPLTYTKYRVQLCLSLRSIIGLAWSYHLWAWKSPNMPKYARVWPRRKQLQLCSVVTSGWVCVRPHNTGMCPQLCCQAAVSSDALLPHLVTLGLTWLHLTSFGRTGTHFVNWSQMMVLIGCDHVHFSSLGSGGLAWSQLVTTNHNQNGQIMTKWV